MGLNEDEARDGGLIEKKLGTKDTDPSSVGC